jgi:hypothetical protein
VPVCPCLEDWYHDRVLGIFCAFRADMRRWISVSTPLAWCNKPECKRYLVPGSYGSARLKLLSTSKAQPPRNHFGFRISGREKHRCQHARWFNPIIRTEVLYVTLDDPCQVGQNFYLEVLGIGYTNAADRADRLTGRSRGGPGHAADLSPSMITMNIGPRACNRLMLRTEPAR